MKTSPSVVFSSEEEVEVEEEGKLVEELLGIFAELADVAELSGAIELPAPVGPQAAKDKSDAAARMKRY